LTDSLAAIKHHVFERGTLTLKALLGALTRNFAANEQMLQLLRNKSPKWGNDDDRADELMRAAFDAFHDAVEGRPNTLGGVYHINMLPTTSHVYFG
jgi:formate C-acetyltransferase